MTTALACLTLEVYYRYLPLFKLDAEPAAKPAAEAAPEHPFGNGPASPAPENPFDNGPAAGPAADNPFGNAPAKDNATKARAGTGALGWLARHQGEDSQWSFDNYKSQCKDASCTGDGAAKADAGATGLALLCYLGAGQTQKTEGPYRRNIERGLVWLVRHQEPDGNLGKDCISPMYSHGLATVALCEAFGRSGDRDVAPPRKRP